MAIEYIHNNPVKAGICRTKEEYEFSSYTKIYQANSIEIQRKVTTILKQDMLQEDTDGEQFQLIDDEKENKEKVCQEVIYKFLQERNLSIEELKRDKLNLIEMVRILKYENNMSYRIMEKNLKISREKLRRLVIKIV